MTVEIIGLVTVVAILTGIVTYFLARSKSNKELIQKSYELESLTTGKEALAFEVSELTQSKEVALQKIRSIELNQQRIEAELHAVSQRKKELENGYVELETKADALVQAKHEAEKSRESSQAELEALKQQQKSLDTRLQAASAELVEMRDSFSEQQKIEAELGKQSKSFEIKAREVQQQYEESKLFNLDVDKKREALQDRYNSLLTEYTELKTSLEERDSSHAKQLTQFDDQKKELSEQFKVLANEILDSKTKALQDSSKLSLSAVMSPFQQSIDSFKKEVQDIHSRETSQRGELRKELESLKELNQKITTEAHELSTALKGQKKLQGNWGELVLENVLDRSGLQLGKDYKREVSFSTEEGRKRPDAVVYLPQDKHLIIDAKVSLNAYTRFINSDDENERTLALSEHVKAMRDRIKELADRDYYKLPGLNSPEIVFMFVPIESAFVEALKADEGLFQSAIENNVLVATPTTLLTSLNIVRQLWRYEDQNKHTVALTKKAESVFKKFNTFLASFEGVKKGLDKAAESYSAAEGQLISGRGNLVKQVGEFKNLAPAIKAELPSYFTDKSELEIDFIPNEEGIDMNSETQK